MDLEEEEEELQGLEWEAEKAYIVATSPRSFTYGSPSSNQPDDDFSWEEDETPSKSTVAVPIICISQDADLSLALDDTSNSKDSSKYPTTSIHATTSLTKAPLPAIMESATESPLLEAKTVNNAVNVLPHTNDTLTGAKTNGSATGTSDEVAFQQPKKITSPSSASSPSSSTQSVTNSHASVPLPPSPDILIIYGPSGIGLSTLVKKLVYLSPQKFSLVISHTSRSPRPSEMYARDYYFVSRGDFLQKVKQGHFMEYVQISRSNSSSYSAQAVSPRQSFSSFPPTSIVKASPDDGDLYGTTYESFREAQYSGKPWVVLNVSTKGAEQLKDIGVKGHYVQMGPKGISTDSRTLVPDHVIRFSNNEEGFSLLENHTLDLMEDDHTPRTPSIYEKAVDEWDRVPSIQLVREDKRRTERLSHKRIASTELLSHFKSADLSEQLSQIKPEVPARSKFSKVFGPSRLSKQLHSERNLVFAMALCKFDDHNSIHLRALSTVYQRLSGSSSPCSRFGSHWEDIGFQGSDPTDDFRGVGMLGLFQLLWFIDSQRLSPIALDIFQYSKSTSTPLPFCVISLNITCTTIQALREGYLSKECNRSEQVISVCNNFYASIFVSFYHNWRRHRKGVMELGNILQGVGNFAKRNAKFMMRELEVYIGNHKKGQGSSQLASPETALVNFSSLDFSV
ncbi:PREDICTED: uncharacterized protein LOC100640320 isoform X2 [Amphimedon queenslandica]|uniref:ELMO domain-containing protein n=1 Tax=Amphimedon queenslandica TaxID=400682 RepID=A0AAN0IY06_AMPQE|nr:PREDICTED: uncharacterized protein LOC100640320 isoform X2 [Amphimedon queenslandica]|eukprot:XP_019849321.1 PREDICTED: uncharacterized protein LOC100640320 isoform X2 [Amphimedon queenslandica]